MDNNRTFSAALAFYEECGNVTMMPISPPAETIDFVRLINIINGVICFVGLSGNIMVFYVVYRFASMRTVTNVFILALALADIAFLVNIPFLITTALLENWPFGNLYYTLQSACPTCHVISEHANGLYCLFALVWLLAILLMIPVFLFSGVEQSQDGLETHCNIFWPDYVDLFDGSQAFALYCFVLGYAFPVFFILIFYGLVIRKLRRRQRHHSRTTATSRITSRRQRSKIQRVSAMILVLILAFLICWTPYWSYQLFITFGIGSSTLMESNTTDVVVVVGAVEGPINNTHKASVPQYGPCAGVTPEGEEDGEQSWIIFTALFLQCLCYANSAVNPVLYAVLSKNFKESYVKAWKCPVTLPGINGSAICLARSRRAGNQGGTKAHHVTSRQELTPLQRNHNPPSKFESDLIL
ncbi:hypothetical protein BV898_17913 [Hypsibius exemplaris]|uniref:G-protein coupled receptors family 1 profile domain-containing protein n=1 Tax=Hypsibius exemplaris TaxID=2072580 RepID=A0A9X6NN19_HYPEX|nr:hypothetical protein BV898_17913 [Hypsibius exemplaris]